LFVFCIWLFFTLSVTPTMARILGRYCLLNGVIMTHCAVFIHHIPIISLSICSLTLSIILYGSEAFYYYTTAVNFYIVFPILISGNDRIFHCYFDVYQPVRDNNLFILYFQCLPLYASSLLRFSWMNRVERNQLCSKTTRRRRKMTTLKPI